MNTGTQLETRDETPSVVYRRLILLKSGQLRRRYSGERRKIAMSGWVEVLPDERERLLLSVRVTIPFRCLLIAMPGHELSIGNWNAIFF